MPRLSFHPLADAAFQEEFLTLGIAAYRDSLAAHPGDNPKRQELADLLFIHEDYLEARAIYRELARMVPDDVGLWQKLAAVEEQMGDLVAARAALRRALDLAIRQESPTRAADIERELERVAAAAAVGRSSTP